jgi:hypothetical protein
MGQRDALSTTLVDEAVKLARRVSEDAERVGPLLARSLKAESGVDLPELGRRARRLLEATAAPPEPETLFHSE